MKSAILGTVSLSGLLLASAQAQTAPAAEETALVQNTVTVTVQKREQNLQDVPLSVSALDQEFLRDLGLDEFDSVARFIPGFEVQEQSPNNPGFVIRGITSDSGEANIEPRIAVFQDGVSISRSRGSIVELFDLERVEVAKGPQPTLFGRGALIGGVNIIQAKADTEALSGRLTVGAGNFGEVYGDAMVNLPVGDAFAVRVAGRLRQRDGFVESVNPAEEDFNGEDMQAVRVSFAYEPSGNMRVDLILNWQQDEATGTSFKSRAFAPGPGLSTDPWEPANLNSFGNFLGGTMLGLDREVQSAALIADWVLSDAWSVTSTTGARHFESLEVFDPDGFGLPLTVFGEDAQGDQISQELRFNYDAGGKLTGFVGGSYFKEDGRQAVPLGFDERAFQGFLAGLVRPPNAPAVETLPAINLTVFAQSGGTVVVPLKPFHEEFFANTGQTVALDVFADATYQLIDRLAITGGVRYTDEDKTTGLEVAFRNGPSALTGAGIIVQGLFAGRIQQSDSFEGFTWRLAASYELSDDWTLFANTARGRRPEVIASSATNPAQRFTLLPAETVDSYEAGAKASLFSDRLLLDGSVFVYDYENFQSNVVNSQGLIVPVNAGNASSEGVELQANWLVSENFDLIASYGYNKARFEESVNGQPQQFGGNPLRLSPDHTASLAARVSFDTGFGTLRIIPSYAWQSEVFFDNTKRDLISEDAYGLANVNLVFDLPGERFSVEAYVNNALDEEYIIDAGNTGDAFGIPTFIAGKPRFYGLRLTGRY